jgi:pyruvate/2-oxoglutarate/acetoin dehydrogenase E1 component
LLPLGKTNIVRADTDVSIISDGAHSRASLQQSQSTVLRITSRDVAVPFMEAAVRRTLKGKGAR